jgi:hypothetical protein
MKSLFLLLLLVAPVHAKMPPLPEPSLCEFPMSKILSSKLRQSGELLMHWCPGCGERHLINIVRDGCGPAWDWDGNAEFPTFSPSILIRTNAPRNQSEIANPVEYTQCHYFIRNGMIEFCGDSAHALAGQTVPLPDFPEWTR